MDISGFLEGIEKMWGPLAALGGAAGAGYALGHYLSQQLQVGNIKRLSDELAQVQRERDQARGQITNTTDVSVQPARLWTTPFAPGDIDLLAQKVDNKVLVVANLKGGVGKSTVAANLAAYFAKDMGLQTLLIDLDYQGTATALAKTQAELDGEDCRIGHILRSLSLEAEHFDLPIPLGAKAPNLWLLSASEELDEIENGLMFKAALRRQDDPDVRMRLARYLRAPIMQQRFQMVVIDTPPRFSAAAVNGLLAATHVLTPTKMEQSSIEAAIRFCSKLRRWNQAGFPATTFLGVLPAMTVQRPNMVPAEIEALNAIDDQLANVLGGQHTAIRDAWVPDTTAIGAAALEGIAYLRNSTARAIFTDVGGAIRRRMF